MTERKTIRSAIADFLSTEIAGGAVLLVATVAALVWANFGTPGNYASAWGRELSLGIGRVSATLTARQWVNDGLMTLFFFVVGLEIKRELITGELSDRRSAALPVAAALGGIAVPALIYTAVTAGSPYVRGWAIPMATDIAFALGALALLSRFVPPNVRLFVLALAIVDDIAAIVVIAIFYVGEISFGSLVAAVGAVVAAVVIRSVGGGHEVLFLVALAVAWALLLESGVHATLAGVAIAMVVPARRPPGRRDTLGTLEHLLHPWVSFLVVPLFALANAGVPVGAASIRFAADQAATWGVIAGLVVGKPLGIALASLIAVRSGLGRLPAGARWIHMIGAGALGGIGFTVSLILVDLSFRSEAVLDATKLAVLAASAVAACIGTVLMLSAGRRSPARA